MLGVVLTIVVLSLTVVVILAAARQTPQSKPSDATPATNPSPPPANPSPAPNPTPPPPEPSPAPNRSQSQTVGGPLDLCPAGSAGYSQIVQLMDEVPPRLGETKQSQLSNRACLYEKLVQGPGDFSLTYGPECNPLSSTGKPLKYELWAPDDMGTFDATMAQLGSILKHC